MVQGFYYCFTIFHASISVVACGKPKSAHNYCNISVCGIVSHE